ncbi:MAG: RagB/SusD family nutrient uptake outer membrane protein, partial [Chitinophagaceae bacterium]|nr:RagB/SusD family nutrient uptake outer membrane protein [Chitinophagaceae bacterium]
MKNKILNIAVVAAAVIGAFSSCNKQLDQTPINQLTQAQVYGNMGNIKQALAGVYGAYSLTGSAN